MTSPAGPCGLRRATTRCAAAAPRGSARAARPRRPQRPPRGRSDAGAAWNLEGSHTHTLTLQKPRLTPKGHMTCHMKIGPDNEVTRAATPHSETTAKGTQRGWSASRHGKAKRREAGCRVIARHSKLQNLTHEAVTARSAPRSGPRSGTARSAGEKNFELPEPTFASK